MKHTKFKAPLATALAASLVLAGTLGAAPAFADDAAADASEQEVAQTETPDADVVSAIGSAAAVDEAAEPEAEPAADEPEPEPAEEAAPAEEPAPAEEQAPAEQPAPAAAPRAAAVQPQVETTVAPKLNAGFVCKVAQDGPVENVPTGQEFSAGTTSSR
ncbi:hypothetical protein GCM10025865_15870 [Paraoerskovia sediminicola]|uniref:Uncharacterized protein n=1 Tax=Paraoerskovia sediminicola TaxID=1138587 RepID=A0ABM8G2G0_9CELL|nr:hypothetical protein [Paraoerskovia sediminicola]BDZ42288.1 hypothetical protein GCM10025865_15870 [Paraoerskovia sediminicola]